MKTLRWRYSTLVVVAGMLTFAPGTSFAQKKQRDRITREEILNSAHKHLDLFQVIRSLRPHFLAAPPGVRSLGGSANQPVSVYIDGKRDTGLDALRTLMAAEVEEVRYFDPTRSESEFGVRAKGGAIAVKLYRAPMDVPAVVRDTTKPPRN